MRVSGLFRGNAETRASEAPLAGAIRALAERLMARRPLRDAPAASAPVVLRPAPVVARSASLADPGATGSPAAAMSYLYPWPSALPGLGRRTVGPFELCGHVHDSVRCSAWSWVRYGGFPTCWACARRWGPDRLGTTGSTAE